MSYFALIFGRQKLQYAFFGITIVLDIGVGLEYTISEHRYEQ